MQKEAIFHRSESDYAYPIDKNKLVIKIRTKKNDVDKVTVHFEDMYQRMRRREKKSSKTLEKIAVCSLFDYYETVIDTTGFLSIYYFFEIGAADETIYYGHYKFFDSIISEGYNRFVYSYICEKDIFRAPEWTKDSIVYQIFPERFCNGDNSLNPPVIDDWDKPLKHYNRFLGGDIIGITSKLDYLQELGINTIYLTPVFESDSSHKYNVTDYYKIDPHFGTNEDFKTMVKEAHKRGIRVILDAVFNHCGVGFFAFQDVLEKGEKSKYKDWFLIKKYPVVVRNFPDYECFGYFGYMPKLATYNKEVAEYFLKVGEFWIKEADIDGWRLDVAPEVDHIFWIKFRERVKEIKKDALIVGEVWHDTRPWLNGDQFDTTMNYIFLNSVADFIAKKSITAEQFASLLAEIRAMYKLPAYNSLWNLLGSHDTERFLFSAKENVALLKLAALIQFTYIGSPVVYYGDEVGMTGDDMQARRGMIWDQNKINTDLLNFYKKIIKIRKTNNELTSGDLKIIFTDNANGIFAFVRSIDNSEILVIINSGLSDYRYSLEKKYINLLDEAAAENFIEIPKESGAVLKKVI